jgi:tRNA/tmRNA/rRNA uracil-C5-methylase (TrmA/RlmC/RlmD family)
MIDTPAAHTPIPSPMLKIGNTVTLEVHDLAFGGEGVARFEDFVIFVAFALPGETIEAEITEVKKRFARARLLRVLVPSTERVQPRCRYYGDCGGCQYQHYDYAAQLRLKQKQVRDILERIGGFENPPVPAAIPCPQHYNYRNRIMVRSQWDKTIQALHLGFIRADSRLVVDVDQCDIAMPGVNDQLRRAHANPPPKGGLKVTLRETPPGWDVPKDAFFQNNTAMLDPLIAAVRERLAQSGNHYLIDAYCGVGFFSIALARDIKEFVGVEYDRMAVEAAKRNLALHGVQNGAYVSGKTEEHLPALLRQFTPEKTTVILDPPRVGCPPQSMENLRNSGVSQILYVSCHPATLARDLNVLCQEQVYELAQVTPVDMFPQTQHIECVADLRRNKKR